ncbi:hypothetical protein WG954_21035 [Lacibacter sp. H375]|uniref:hypothetical protein n=1 Tax=Lacibacter sp. H375 TaxID=3133424 RepID=UPI0030C409F1
MPQQNEQYESKESFYHLDLCCRMAAEKIGKASFESWTNGDYLRLSGQLFRQTNVQISPSTLKRIFGKLKTTDRYYPQKATRDALVQYSGYSDWDAFLAKHPKPVATKEEEPVAEATKNISANPVSKQRRNIYIIIALLLIAVIIFWVLQKNKSVQSVTSADVDLLCSKPEGEAPHSTTFTIKLANSFKGDKDNFTIDFGDGRREKEIDEGLTISHFYEIPGRYYALLKYDGIPVDSVSVYLKTNGWTATAQIQFDTAKVYPVNINRYTKTGKLEVMAEEVSAAGVDTSKAFFVHFVNTKPLPVDADNFELNLWLSTSLPRPGIRCSQADITVYGEQSSHFARFIKPGCVSWSLLNFSEIHHEGEREDLSFLGVDLTAGGRIKLKVVNKKATLSINDKIVHETTYRFPLKKFYGMRITFGGIGVINGFALKDLQTGNIYSEGLANIQSQ